MSAAKKVLVRNMRTDEIREVSPEQREVQDKSIWVPITGKDVKPTASPVSATDESSVEPDAGETDPKTTPKATAPKK